MIIANSGQAPSPVRGELKPSRDDIDMTREIKAAADYSETPQTLAEHLKKRRRKLGLFQREAASQMGVWTETYVNWERGKTEPVASQFLPVLDFLGYDPTPRAVTIAERLQVKRRALGVTFSQVAQYLGWNEGTLTRYLNGTWHMPPNRAAALEAFLTDGKAILEAIHQLPRRHQATRD